MAITEESQKKMRDLLTDLSKRIKAKEEELKKVNYSIEDLTEEKELLKSRNFN